jgi:hypothetical protein
LLPIIVNTISIISPHQSACTSHLLHSAPSRLSWLPWISATDGHCLHQICHTYNILCLVASPNAVTLSSWLMCYDLASTISVSPWVDSPDSIIFSRSQIHHLYYLLHLLFLFVCLLLSAALWVLYADFTKKWPLLS